MSFVGTVLAPIASTVSTFAQLSTEIFEAVYSAVVAVNNGVTSTANMLISIAGDMATVGINVFRTLSAIAGMPDHLRAAMSRVASAYNEVFCIFQNSLRPRKTYEDYDGLYGASNCSSTTGGRGPSAYSNLNAFALMQEQKGPIELSSGALSSIAAVSRGDPVLAPIPLPELDRHLQNINSGTQLDTSVIAQ
ncbi:hypothetical protein D3C76_1164080 [compost metagenome]